jgi:3-hydroxyisobutyrate dehydrogenase-like beta-hydroxyacid dehydrogenase
MSAQAEHVGFVGLGNMGTPMVKCLLKAGFEVVVRDLRRQAAEECIAAGAQFAETNQELAEACEIIGIAVVNDAQLVKLTCDEGGLLSVAKPGTLLVVHSTVMPETIRLIGEKAAQKNVQLIDAQMSGGDLRAQKGDLAIMVGGPTEQFERCKPYFAAIARCAEHMGDLGAAAATKLAIQMMAFGNWLAAMEAMRVARALDIDEKKLARFAADTTADSWVLQTWGNYDRLLHTHPLAGSEALFRMFDKDLFNSLALGKELGLSLPVTAVGSQVLADAMRERIEYSRETYGKSAPLAKTA